MTDFYPEIDPAQLELLIDLHKQDPGYILGAPYPQGVIEFFLGQTQVDADPSLAGTSGEMSKWELLEKQSDELFQALTEAGRNLKDKDDAARMAYFRTATSLLERIVGIQERAVNLKRVSQFQQAVLSIMDEVLDGDQRAAVRERLELAAQED